MTTLAKWNRALVITGCCIAWACSGSDGSSTSNGQNDASTTGSGGDRVDAGSGASGGGNAGASGSGASGSGASGSGASGSGGGASGAAGAGGSSGTGGATGALTCAKNEDCIVAYGHANKGCCFRGCGSAYNRDYVKSEPCVSADNASDPVPASCDTGCLACPASHCQDVYGAVCVAGQCTSVTQYGPCATNDDCVLAIDYASTTGGCCSCPEIATKLLIANDRCVVLDGQPKPQGCAPTPAGVCDTLGCPATCGRPTMLKCDKGMCTGT